MHQDLAQSNRHSESGNALWFILLAIALLVALTITITRSSENSEETGSRDRDRILASAILRQAKGISSAIDQMRLNGIAENDISFDNATITGYANAKCTDGSCLLFGSAGAGIAYMPPPTEWLDTSKSAETLYGEWYFYGTACVPGVGTGGTGCSANASASELIIGLPWINESICIEINRLSGVINLTGPTRPPVLTDPAYTASLDKYIGTFTANTEINDALDSFKGKQTGCFKGGAANPDGGYHFYQVAIPR